MISDMCFPKNNEKQFIEKAEKIGTNELIFIYPYSKKADPKKIISNLWNTTKVKLKYGFIADPKEVMQAKRKSDYVIVESSEKNQHTIEKYKPSLIFNLETSSKEDRTHYRFSNLNQVICKLCKNNNTTIGISFSNVLKSKPKRRAVLIGRIAQNIRLCKKYSVELSIFSFANRPSELRSIKDLESLKKVISR